MPEQFGVGSNFWPRLSGLGRQCLRKGREEGTAEGKAPLSNWVQKQREHNPGNGTRYRTRGWWDHTGRSRNLNRDTLERRKKTHLCHQTVKVNRNWLQEFNRLSEKKDLSAGRGENRPSRQRRTLFQQGMENSAAPASNREAQGGEAASWERPGSLKKFFAI
ncbi:Hypothetical predicted protein [Podarcis lilfordi]|uniref:Uncharacterized protein n=1 Tax=Podarcis lilfordi TaxID=74358 RepID=A0AA35L185_9SAUR|nr:Hypothetical predicted protein [Podarcis lilfordi]